MYMDLEQMLKKHILKVGFGCSKPSSFFKSKKKINAFAIVFLQYAKKIFCIFEEFFCNADTCPACISQKCPLTCFLFDDTSASVLTIKCARC